MCQIPKTVLRQAPSPAKKGVGEGAWCKIVFLEFWIIWTLSFFDIQFKNNNLLSFKVPSERVFPKEFQNRSYFLKYVGIKNRKIKSKVVNMWVGHSLAVYYLLQFHFYNFLLSYSCSFTFTNAYHLTGKLLWMWPYNWQMPTKKALMLHVSHLHMTIIT